jgi:hypothetical protein
MTHATAPSRPARQNVLARCAGGSPESDVLLRDESGIVANTDPREREEDSSRAGMHEPRHETAVVVRPFALTKR